MKAIILYQQVHSLLHNGDSALQINLENWTPVPAAILDVEHPELVYIGLPYDARLNWFSPEAMLRKAKELRKEEFAAVFLHLESRAARAVSTLTLAMVSGVSTFADDDFDAGLLWSIEQIKQANRDLLAGLEALTIPADATFAEAQAIIAEAVAVKPWMPEEAGIAE